MPHILSLPTELRCQIYDHLLHDPSDWYRRYWRSANRPHPTVQVHLDKYPKYPGSGTRVPDPRDVLLLLTLVNKQVHDEIEELFYPRFTFWFNRPSAEKIRAFCTSLSPKARELIRHAKCSFQVTWHTKKGDSMLLRAQQACEELAAGLPGLRSAAVCIVFTGAGRLMPTEHDAKVGLQDGIMDVVGTLAHMQSVSLEDVEVSSYGSWGSIRCQIMEECRQRLRLQMTQIGA